MEKQSVGRPCAHQAAVALAGCGKRPPAAFSHRFAAHRTARVRFASSLAAALLDGHFAHPAGDSDTETAHELIITSCATIECFLSLLGLAKTCRAGSPVSLSAAGRRWKLAHFSSTVPILVVPASGRASPSPAGDGRGFASDACKRSEPGGARMCAEVKSLG